MLPIVMAVITPHINEGILPTMTNLRGTGIAALRLAAGLVPAAATPAEAKFYEYT